MVKSNIPRILVLIGAILSIIQGIFTLAGVGSIYNNLLIKIIFGILAILLGILLLSTSGYVKSFLSFQIPMDGVPLLIAGIVEIVLSSYLGGVLVIIAAILLLIK